MLDTNILVSALISRSGPTDRLYSAWKQRRYDLVTNNEQLEELRRVTRYPQVKRLLDPGAAGTMHNPLRDSAIVLDKLPTNTGGDHAAQGRGLGHRGRGSGPAVPAHLAAHQLPWAVYICRAGSGGQRAFAAAKQSEFQMGLLNALLAGLRRSSPNGPICNRAGADRRRGQLAVSRPDRSARSANSRECGRIRSSGRRGSRQSRGWQRRAEVR